jgi:hypothetical protein
MSELQIKSESFPQRCEICHQNDCFDLELNYCSRCSNLDNEIVNNKNITESIVKPKYYTKPTKDKNVSRQPLSILWKSAWIGIVAGISLGFINLIIISITLEHRLKQIQPTSIESYKCSAGSAQIYGFIFFPFIGLIFGIIIGVIISSIVWLLRKTKNYKRNCVNTF